MTTLRPISLTFGLDETHRFRPAATDQAPRDFPFRGCNCECENCVALDQRTRAILLMGVHSIGSSMLASQPIKIVQCRYAHQHLTKIFPRFASWISYRGTRATSRSAGLLPSCQTRRRRRSISGKAYRFGPHQRQRSLIELYYAISGSDVGLFNVTLPERDLQRASHNHIMLAAGVTSPYHDDRDWPKVGAWVCSSLVTCGASPASVTVRR
jgi:hypothetical protein